MKSTTKLLTAVAAALVMATGAQAQEAKPEGANNLGTAVVSASQDGMFGGMGSTGMAVGVLAGMAVFYAVMADESESTTQPPAPAPTPPTEPPTHETPTHH